MHVLQVVEHVIALKTSFLQQKNYLYHALLYLEPKHGLLVSTFKVLIGLPLVILLARHERQDILKNSSVTNMRARTLPGQNDCRVKADGMGPSYRRRFPLRCYTQDLAILVYGTYGCKSLVIQLLCVQ